jgi:hypothetical protein
MRARRPARWCVCLRSSSSQPPDHGCSTAGFTPLTSSSLAPLAASTSTFLAGPTSVVASAGAVMEPVPDTFPTGWRTPSLASWQGWSEVVQNGPVGTWVCDPGSSTTQTREQAAVLARTNPLPPDVNDCHCPQVPCNAKPCWSGGPAQPLSALTPPRMSTAEGVATNFELGSSPSANRSRRGWADGAGAGRWRQ